MEYESPWIRRVVLVYGTYSIQTMVDPNLVRTRREIRMPNKFLLVPCGLHLTPSSGTRKSYSLPQQNPILPQPLNPILLSYYVSFPFVSACPLFCSFLGRCLRGFAGAAEFIPKCQPTTRQTNFCRWMTGGRV